MRNSPRCATRMRFGVSASTPELPPKAKPGFANGLCHDLTTVYGLSPKGPVITACGDGARIAPANAHAAMTETASKVFVICFTSSPLRIVSRERPAEKLSVGDGLQAVPRSRSAPQLYGIRG